MTRALLIAVAFASSIGTMQASAQERHGYRDGGHRHYGPSYRNDYWRPHFAPRYWSVPVRPYRYYDPYWAYPGPALAYGYSVYEPEPIIIEREYPRQRFYEAIPEAPRYEERSYAQVTPPAPLPEPSRAPQPAPRLERYTLSASELFEFDRAVLRKPQPKLDEIAEALQRNPRIDGVTITGYTDRIGSKAYNQKLSQRRANAVKAYLVAAGVSARRLEAVGKGMSNPIVQCADTNKKELIRCLEPNRRVEVEQITVERRAR